MPSIDRPVFLLGPGRSGSTLLLRMIALHPDLAYFSGWTDRFPRLPQLAFLARLNNYPDLQKRFGQLRGWPLPGECLRIWNYCFKDFSNATCDWRPGRARQPSIEKLRYQVRAHLRWQGKSRFLTKYTGWPRIKFIRASFPDALFIHIERDPRAVVYSYIKQGWSPNRTAALSVREKIEFYSSRYLSYYQAKREYEPGEDYHQVLYEDLITDPVRQIQGCFSTIGLNWIGELETRYETWPMTADSNEQWRRALDEKEQLLLLRCLYLPLQEMGYAVRWK